VISRASGILRPPIVTATVKSQKTDLLGEKSDVIQPSTSGPSSKGRASSACASDRRRTGAYWRSRCQMLQWRARQVLGAR
jgi:hypothetical protein